MSRWVSHEYEGALAFLFIAISALLPWSVSTATTDVAGTVRIGRWWFGELRQVTKIPDFNGFYPIMEAVQMQQGQGIYNAYLMSTVAAVIFGVAVALATALLLREEAVVDRVPIRFVGGGLLMASGIIFLAANFWISMRGIPGTYVPVGGAFQILFGTVLVTNRYKSDAKTVAPEPEPDAEPDVQPES